MNDTPHTPSSRLVFDKTIQISTLIALFTLTVTGIGGAFTIYQSVQSQLYDQKMETRTALSKIETLSADIRVVRDNLDLLRTVVRENISAVKADQKETDNALRKSLDSISEDLIKLRLSLAGRRDRTQWMFDGSSGTGKDADPSATERVPTLSAPISYH